MVKFEVYKKGKLVDKFALCGAYLFGMDEIALRDVGQITFKKGIVECGRRELESAALALLWPIEGFGKVLLSTTRLPHRERPYNLNVELARARLMQITVKREDWSLFDEGDNFDSAGRQARDLFIQALQNISNGAKASVLADESLAKAMVFSEKLAAKHAELFFEARRKNRNFGRGSLGCKIDPERTTDSDYVEKLAGMFRFVTIPVNWAKTEPYRDSYDFTLLDQCINALVGKKLVICAGPLLCFSEEYLPRWLLEEGGSFEKIREKAFEFVAKVVQRYSRFVHIWRVISGINALNHFGFGFEQILEMTRAGSLAARAESNRSLKIIEIEYPWGEYYAKNSNSIPPLVYVDMVVQSGINFDAFGLCVRFGKNEAGMYVRDMMQISSVLDRFGMLNRPLHITSVAVPSGAGSGSNDCGAAGIWHKSWDQSVQAQWLEQFYKIALSKPFVNTITYSNLTDGRNEIVPDSGLLTEKLEPKKSFTTIRRLQKLLLKR